jgi:hypothetical protein
MLQYLSSPTTPEALDALRLELVAGRWLEPGDEALEFTPQVITQDLARRLFGREDPLGRTIDGFDEKGQPETIARAGRCSGRGVIATIASRVSSPTCASRRSTPSRSRTRRGARRRGATCSA